VEKDAIFPAAPFLLAKLGDSIAAAVVIAAATNVHVTAQFTI